MLTFVHMIASITENQLSEAACSQALTIVSEVRGLLSQMLMCRGTPESERAMFDDL